MHDHEGSPVETVDAGEVCDLVGPELSVRVEVAQPDRLVTQVSVESDQSHRVGRLNLPDAEVCVRTDDLRLSG